MKQWILFFSLILLATTGCQQYEHPSTWSIVAADPATGDVGVAAASCVPQSIDALASLVPGQGVAASQAAFVLENRDRVFELLKTGESAENIVNTVTSADADAASRQYGVITIQEGNATIAGFTGANNGNWAGDRSSESILPVTAQGNILEGEEVVSAALAAFNDPDLGEVLLSDRLMWALEAGSAAGGDTRCNRVVHQTAAAAFIVVAQGGEAPFAVAGFGQSAPNSAESPSLHLSVSGGVGAANPIIELRAQYDQWRHINVEPCESCNLAAIEVPTGGNGLTSILGTILFIIPPWLMLVCGGIFALIIWLFNRWRVNRKRRLR